MPADKDREVKPLWMSAYYFDFEPTGVRAIDLILSAVASAGKQYHHTEGWLEETPAFESEFRGSTPAERIQNAAFDAAKAFSALPETQPPTPQQPATLMDPHTYAYWLADKIPALGDYAKEAAQVLRRQADQLLELALAPQSASGPTVKESLTVRPCTCHPDDNPPRPCPQKYALTECREAAARSTTPLISWLRDNAPDCGDNSCLFGGRGKGGMRTNGGCRCMSDLPTKQRIYVERMQAALSTASAIGERKA